MHVCPPRAATRRSALAAVFLSFFHAVAAAATVPAGFSESLVAGGMSAPTAMDFAPDGRLFVCEQGGQLRVIKNGTLLPTPFLSVTVSQVGERGLLGIAFDPDFAANQYVYIYYTATTPNVHNRVSRFTANGDVAVPGSEVVLLDLPGLVATNHNGGAIHFGPDGKLYVAVGENAVASNSQTLASPLGKILRINADGSVPADNPFYNTAGAYRAIWALGLRNPFTFSFNPGSGVPAMAINDVGSVSWEEINDGIAGANYGWPNTEGPTTNPLYISPRYAYDHGNMQCAITGGAFYAPAVTQFPAEYLGDYFFADLCAGWIRKLDPAAGNTVTTFATGISGPVDLKVGPDGALYYLSINDGTVYRVLFTDTPPAIATHPASVTVAPGQTATFSVQASGGGTLRYQWQRNAVDIAGATAASYTTPAATLADNGARFRVRVSNDFGNVISNDAVLTVTGTAPAIATHPANRTVEPGQAATFSVVATGSPMLRYQWQRDGVEIAGATAASYTLPAATPADNGARFRVRVSNDFGNAISNDAVLTVTGTAPAIATHPASVTVALGQTATFSVQASGGGTLRYQWQRDGVDIAGATAAFYTTPAATLADNGARFRVRVSNDFGNALSNDAVLTVTGTAPAIATHPANRTVEPGQAATFSVVATGSPMLRYQWQRDGVDIAGATAASYTMPAATLADNGARFRVRVSNDFGNAISNDAVLTVAIAAPTGLAAHVNGLTVVLSWNASASASSYRLEAGSSPGAANLFNSDVGTATTLRVVAAAGTYHVRLRVANAFGTSGPSNEIIVTTSGSAVCASPPPAPGGLAAQVAGLQARLSWNASPGADSYVVEAGSAAGQANLGAANVGAVTTVDASGPTGTYFGRVRAVNACGAGAASSEVMVTLACTSAPAAPSNLAFSRSGVVVALSWTGPFGAAGYRISVGSTPGASNVTTADVGAVTGVKVDTTGVAAGVYYVRVAALSACGVSGPSNEIAVSLP